MRVAVISDIHGNRHALEAVLSAIAREGVDAVWCLGDLVGYGADPEVCVALAREHADVCLVGNHDLAVRGDLSLEEFSSGAATAARWTREVIGPETLEFLTGLVPADPDQAAGLYHASPRDPVWEYVLSTDQAEACFEVQARRVCLVGHSHVALAFSRDGTGETSGALRPAGTALDLSAGDWLLNPGAVGQPRDGDPHAAWLLLDTEVWHAEYRREPYDVEGAAAAIRAAGLPVSLAERLAHGQ